MFSINLLQITLIVTTLITTISSYSYSYSPSRKQFQHFEDYLINNSEKVVIVEVGNDNRESELINSVSLTPTTTISPTIKDQQLTTTTTTQSPEEKEEAELVNCCLLGRLAGEHGYHCHVDFYAARIINRNENRAHNKKIYFNGKHRTGLYGTSTMKKFESCIENRGRMFHKCCKIASRIHLQGPRYDTAKRLHSG